MDDDMASIRAQKYIEVLDFVQKKIKLDAELIHAWEIRAKQLADVANKLSEENNRLKLDKERMSEEIKNLQEKLEKEKKIKHKWWHLN